MPITSFSKTAIHAFVQNTTYIIQNPRNHQNQVAGAFSCSSCDSNNVLLVSSAGHFRHFIPTSSICTLPEKFFTASSSKLPNTPNRAVKLKSVFGKVASVSSIHSPCQTKDTDCSCQLAVCASNAYLQLSFHTLRVTSSFTWALPFESLSHIVTLPFGPLRETFTPASQASAVIATTVSGTVRASCGARIQPILRHPSWSDSSSDVLNLFQAPIFCEPDLANCFVCIIGTFASSVILYRNHRDILVAKRFLFNVPPSRLTADTLIVRRRGNAHMIIEHRPTTQVVEINYDENTKALQLTQHCPDPFQAVFKQKSSSIERTLRSLLRGIEGLTKKHTHADVDAMSIQRLISSYNSAFSFVSEWTQQRKNIHTMSQLAKNCHISIQTVAAPNSPLFHVPEPIAGQRCFLTVSFRNITGIALSHGWTLHVQLSSVPLHRNSSKIGGETGKKDLFPDADPLIANEMHAPLREVAPDETSVISFPISISSHAPFYVSIVLRFQHPSALPYLRRDGLDIALNVLNDATVDILDYSNHHPKLDEHDTSRELLLNPSIARHFSRTQIAGIPRNNLLLCRFELPFSQTILQQILGFPSGDSNVYFKTISNALFTITLGDSPGNSVKSGVSATTVCIQGVPHIIHFVRSSIVRRILRRIREDTTEGIALSPEMNLDYPAVGIRGGGNIERWQRGIIDGADNSLKSLRSAEAALVDCLRLYEQMERHGDISCQCRNGKEQEAVQRSVATVRTTYNEWRREVELAWSPPGATYTQPSKLSSAL